MRSKVSSAPEIERRYGALVAIALLGVSAAALAVAPAFMPDGYRWGVHTASESAAQGLEGAWVARLGFLTFGFGALLSVATASRARWARSVVAMRLLQRWDQGGGGRWLAGASIRGCRAYRGKGG